MFCTQCGKKSKKNARFCENCGLKLHNENSQKTEIIKNYDDPSIKPANEKIKKRSFFSLPFLDERPVFKKIVVIIWILVGVRFVIMNRFNYNILESLLYAAGALVGIFIISLILSIIPILILRHRINKISSLIFGIILIIVSIITILGSIFTY